MLESYANGASASVVPNHVQISELPPASPITADQKKNHAAGFSLSLDADDLLSRCWERACEFARNFGASHISIEFLLMGATHIRDAEPVLIQACRNVEALSHDLATRCVRRTFEHGQLLNHTYLPDKTLKALLLEAGALATSKDVPSVTLSFVLEAAAAHTPTLPVLAVLPQIALKKQERTESLHPILQDIAKRIETLELHLGEPPVTQDQELLPFYPKKPDLAAELTILQRDVAQLKNTLLYLPSGRPDVYVAPSLNIPTHHDLGRALERLQHHIVSEIEARLAPPAPVALTSPTPQEHKPSVPQRLMKRLKPVCVGG